MNMKMRSRAARLRAIEQELLEATYLESKWVTFNQCVEDSGSFKANGKTDCKWRSIATVSCTGAGCSIGRTKCDNLACKLGGIGQTRYTFSNNNNQLGIKLVLTHQMVNRHACVSLFLRHYSCRDTRLASINVSVQQNPIFNLFGIWKWEKLVNRCGRWQMKTVDLRNWEVQFAGSILFKLQLSGVDY